ncbi:MAG: molecular chaperone DnaJ [Leptospiraceae bacterium]|nr:molecular chaperone DnaJ [Leptospiraceae bacterium]
MQKNTPHQTETPFQALDGLVEELQTITDRGTWFLPSEKLISILNVRKEDYYKKLYTLRNSDFNPSGLRGFHETDGEPLCKLISMLLNLDILIIEECLERAGIFFSEDSLTKVEDYFLARLTNSVQRHKLDKELLMLLTSATLSFEDAFDSYFDDKFELEVFIGRSVDSYLFENSIDTAYGADEFLKRFLLNRLKYKKLNIQELKAEYVDRYYYELYGRFRKSPKKQNLSSEIIFLLKFFQLDEYADRTSLKKRYQELLKKFHPDINKNGLEKTKDIIEKYKRLDSILE